jgi:hypothetical protein
VGGVRTNVDAIDTGFDWTLVSVKPGGAPGPAIISMG